MLMASNKLLVGCTLNIPIQEQICCLMFAVPPPSMVNIMNFCILLKDNNIRNELF